MLGTVTRRRSHEADVIAGTAAATVFHQLPVAALVMDAFGAVVLRESAGTVAAQAVALDSIVAR